MNADALRRRATRLNRRSPASVRCAATAVLSVLLAGGPAAGAETVPQETLRERALGQAAAEQRDWPTAIAHFRAARKTSPVSPTELYFLGLAYAQMGRRPLVAVPWFEAFLAAAPESGRAELVRQEIAARMRLAAAETRALLRAAEKAQAALPEPSPLAARDIGLARAALQGSSFSAPDAGSPRETDLEDRFAALPAALTADAGPGAVERAREAAEGLDGIERDSAHAIVALAEDRAGRLDAAHRNAAGISNPALSAEVGYRLAARDPGLRRIHDWIRLAERHAAFPETDDLKSFLDLSVVYSYFGWMDQDWHPAETVVGLARAARLWAEGVAAIDARRSAWEAGEPPAPPPLAADEARLWLAALGSSDPALARAYLARHPEGAFAVPAELLRALETAAAAPETGVVEAVSVGGPHDGVYEGRLIREWGGYQAQAMCREATVRLEVRHGELFGTADVDLVPQSVLERAGFRIQFDGQLDARGHTDAIKARVYVAGLNFLTLTLKGSTTRGQWQDVLRETCGGRYELEKIAD